MSRLPTLQTGSLSLPFAERAGIMGGFQNLYSAPPQEQLGLLGKLHAATDKSAFGFNQALAEQIDRGYQDVLGFQGSAAEAIRGGYADQANRLRQQNEGIAGGYNRLSSDVLAGIEGIGRTEAGDIDRRYEQDFARAQQGLINSGLGGSTMMATLGRGIASDRERASTALAERIAGLRAGYQSSLGQAGLGFRERGLGAETSLGLAGLGYDERAAGQQAAVAQNRLGWMNTISAPYPDVGVYAGLAQQIGAAGQAGLDRNLLMQQLGAQQRAADQAGRGGGGAEVSSPTFGGGLARGSGGLPGPEANYGGNPVYQLQGAGGFAPPSPIGAAAFAPALTGAGGGFTGAAQIAPGFEMESAGAYAGYGGQPVAGSGFGGGTGSTGATTYGTSGGGGGYSGYGGGTFAGGYGGGYGGETDQMLADLADYGYGEW